MGGKLSIKNSTGRSLFASLEQTPYSARYWGHIEPNEEQTKWRQPYAAFDQGYYVLRVFDKVTLPGRFREPRAWSEALKSIAYGVSGALMPPLVLAELGVRLATGNSIKATNNDARRWVYVVPETGQRAQTVELVQAVRPGVRIGTDTAFEVTENVEGQLEIIEIITSLSEGTPGASRRQATPSYRLLSGELATNQPETPVLLHGNSDPGSECANLPTLHSVTPEAYLRGFDAIVESEFTYAGEGKTFPLNGYGFRLSIPPNALHESEQCKIAVKAALNGQFRFPEGTRLVSGMYWISCPHTRFTEDVTVEIQHCANKDQLSSLQFVVAKCSQEELPYAFVPLKRPANFPAGSSYGSVTLREFFIVGIVEDVRETPTPGPRHRYSAKVFYENDSANTWIVHFVIVKPLDLCGTAINDKYRTLKHGADLEVCFQEDKITLDIPEEEDMEVKKGWNIASITPPTITKEQVDDYIPGRRRTPSCQLLVMWNEFGPRNLVHKVNLMGADEPFNFFRICLSVSQGITSPDHVLELSEKYRNGLQGKPDLLDLMNEVAAEIPAKWKRMGTELKVTDGDLSAIAISTGTPIDCFYEVFRTWKGMLTPHTWETVIKALKAPAVSEQQLAHDLSNRLSQHTHIL